MPQQSTEPRVPQEGVQREVVLGLLSSDIRRIRIDLAIRHLLCYEAHGSEIVHSDPIERECLSL